MTPRALIVATVVGGALLCAPATGRAQSPLAPGTWMASPLIGAAFDTGASPALAGAVAFPVTSALGIEAEFARLSDLAPADRPGTPTLTTVHVAALYFVTAKTRLTPYLAGGLGAGKVSHQMGRPESSEQMELGLNLGGGTTYPINGWAFVRGDGRFFRHLGGLPSAWRVAIGATARFGQ